MRSPSAFQWCLGSIPVATFLDEWWERAPLAVQGRDAGTFVPLLTRTVFEALLSHANLRQPFFRIFKNGERLPPSSCTLTYRVGPANVSDFGDVAAMWRVYQEGGTIAALALERVHGPLADLCLALEAFFKCPVQADAYLTPAGATGPPARFEEHETFLLQIQGRSRCRIWNPVRTLPVRSVHALESGAGVEPAPGHPPRVKCSLNAGDSLYIPRGFVYSTAAAEVASLQILIGVRVVPWVQVVRRAVRQVARSLDHDPNAQVPVAFGQATGGGDPAGDESEVRRLAARIIESVDVDAVLASLAASPSPPGVSNRRGAFLRRLRPNSPDASSVQ